MKKKTSPVWEPPAKEFQELLDKSNSIADVLRSLGMDPYCGNHKTVHARVKQDGLSLKQLEGNRSKAYALQSRLLHRLPDELVFCEGKHYDGKLLRERLLERGVEYRCVDCGVRDKYNDKPISLQVDHINGINDDNRIENLRLLCPNCHSQTPTFGKKRFKGSKKYESDEDRQKRIERSRKFNPTKVELTELVGKMPITQIANKFSVSDNAVRKRCRLMGISLRV